MQLALHILREAPSAQALDDAVTHLDPRLRAMVLHMLEKDPAKRPLVAELHDDPFLSERLGLLYLRNAVGAATARSPSRAPPSTPLTGEDAAAARLQAALRGWRDRQFATFVRTHGHGSAPSPPAAGAGPRPELRLSAPPTARGPASHSGPPHGLLVSRRSTETLLRPPGEHPPRPGQDLPQIVVPRTPPGTGPRLVRPCTAGQDRRSEEAMGDSASVLHARHLSARRPLPARSRTPLSPLLKVSVRRGSLSAPAVGPSRPTVRLAAWGAMQPPTPPSSGPMGMSRAGPQSPGGEEVAWPTPRAPALSLSAVRGAGPGLSPVTRTSVRLRPEFGSAMPSRTPRMVGPSSAASPPRGPAAAAGQDASPPRRK